MFNLRNVFTCVAAVGVITMPAIRVIRALRRRSEDDADIGDPYESRRYLIAIVDDEAGSRFPEEMRNALATRGFHIRYFEDIAHVQELARFHIVMCDVRGVGLCLGLTDKFHGGLIVEELRKAYPLKFVILYSALAINASLSRYYRLADLRFSRGDLYGENIVPILEDAIRNITSPEDQWRRITSHLCFSESATLGKSWRIGRKIKKLRRRIFTAAPEELARLCLGHGIRVSGVNVASSPEDISEALGKMSEVLLAVLSNAGD